MNKILLSLLAVCLLCACDFIQAAKDGYKMGKELSVNVKRAINGFGDGVDDYLATFECDTFILSDANIHYSLDFEPGKQEITFNPYLAVTFVKHGTLMLDYLGFGGSIVHVDPVSMFGTDYTKMPKADVLLVTHEHGDHLDTAAISILKQENTRFYSNKRVEEITGASKGLVAGEVISESVFNIIPVLAYNTTEGRTQFHPKGRDLGFVLEYATKYENKPFRVYIAGDTEPIEEMKSLGDIDVAFLPVNQPYTMTPEQAIEAIEMIKPKVVYPYHYGNTDLTPIVEHFKNNAEIEVRIRQLQ